MSAHVAALMKRYDIALKSVNEGSNEVGFRICREHSEEILQLFRANDIKVSPVVQATATMQEVVCLLTASAGLSTGLAAVLRTFFNRHKDKEFSVRVGDVETTVKGCSAEEAARLVSWAMASTTASQTDDH